MRKIWIVTIQTLSRESAEQIKKDIESGKSHPQYQCNQVEEKEG